MTGIITSIPPLVEQQPGNNASNPAGLPGLTYTVAVLNIAQTWTALQTFPLGNITINAADVVGLSPSSTIDTTNASNITSGTLPAGRMPALTGDVTSTVGTVSTTLATVNANVGTFGSATQSVQFTANGKGLLTAAANVTITPAVGSITGLGTGVATALGVNVGTAGAPVVNGGALGTPSSGTLTNATGLPIATGVANLGTGVATFLTTPSSANLRAALTDEVGTGAAYFVGGALGTPASGTATNLTGTAAGLTAGTVTTNANMTGDVTSVGNATTLAAGNAGNLNSGTLLAGRMPALTGEVTTSAGAVATSIARSTAFTWTGTHIFSNGTLAAQFTGGIVGFNNGATTPTAPVHVGDVAAASSGANILSARNSTGATSVHGFAENSTINLSANGQGMDSFDARMVVSGTATYDHFVSYQSRPVYGSSGIATWGYGVWDQIAANGPITNTASFYASNPIGTSTITNVYGLYVEALTKGGTLNYGVFTAGTTPSKFGGNVDVASLSVAGTDATSAWSTYTPTITAQTGTFTSITGNSGRYKQIGKTVHFNLTFTITTVGTASGYVIATLPVAAKTGVSSFTFSGIRSGLVGLAGIIDTTTTIDIVDASAGASPIAAGRALYVSGTYEAN